jgi:hypothetical protein
MRVLALLLVLWSSLTLVAADAPLDGRSFTITLVAEDSGKTQGQDLLRFAEGHGECQNAGRKYGYAKGLCTTTAGRKKGDLGFRFVMTSAEHGELLVIGTVSGGSVSGTRTWSKPGKTPIVHRFSGTQP